VRDEERVWLSREWAQSSPELCYLVAPPPSYAGAEAGASRFSVTLHPLGRRAARRAIDGKLQSLISETEGHTRYLTTAVRVC